MNAQTADTTQTWLRDKSECPWVTKLESWRTQSQGTWKWLSWCNLQKDLQRIKTEYPQIQTCKAWVIILKMTAGCNCSTGASTEYRGEHLNVYVHILLFLYLHILIQYLTMLKHLNVCQLHGRLIFKRNISFLTLDLISLISHPSSS